MSICTLIGVGLLLGLDSLAVGAGLGAARADLGRRRQLSLSFAVCDGLASFLGALAGGLQSDMAWAEWLGPTAVASYGVYVLYLTWHCRTLAAAPSRWLVFCLPVCLSIDNFAVGVGAEVDGFGIVPMALFLGAVSGGLALLGMALGSALPARSKLAGGWVGGVLLMITGAYLFVREAL